MSLFPPLCAHQVLLFLTCLSMRFFRKQPFLVAAISALMDCTEAPWLPLSRKDLSLPVFLKSTPVSDQGCLCSELARRKRALGGSHTLISSTWADQPWKQQAELTLTRRAHDTGGCFSIPTSRKELHSARTEQMPRARRVGSCLEQHNQSCRNLTQRSSPDILKLETQNQGVGRVTCLLELWGSFLFQPPGAPGVPGSWPHPPCLYLCLQMTSCFSVTLYNPPSCEDICHWIKGQREQVSHFHSFHLQRFYF